MRLGDKKSKRDVLNVRRYIAFELNLTIVLYLYMPRVCGWAGCLFITQVLIKRF